MNVRISPPWQNTVKKASGKERLKNFTSGASFWPVATMAPAVRGSRLGKLSISTGVIDRYLKNTNPKRAI